MSTLLKRLLVVAAIVVLLSACNTGSDNSPSPSPTASQMPTQGLSDLLEESQSPDEEAFIDLSRSESEYRGRDNTLLELGYAMCDLTTAGGVERTFDTLVKSATDEQQAYDLGVIYVVAANFLCPEHSGAVEKFFSSSSGV